MENQVAIAPSGVKKPRRRNYCPGKTPNRVPNIDLTGIESEEYHDKFLTGELKLPDKMIEHYRHYSRRLCQACNHRKPIAGGVKMADQSFICGDCKESNPEIKEREMAAAAKRAGIEERKSAKPFRFDPIQAGHYTVIDNATGQKIGTAFKTSSGWGVITPAGATRLYNWKKRDEGAEYLQQLGQQMKSSS